MSGIRGWFSRLCAFLHGLWEFRTGFTTYYGPDLIETYDSGRELAHKLTLRQFEQ